MIRCWPIVVWHPTHPVHHVHHGIRHARRAGVALAAKVTGIACVVVPSLTAPLWAPPVVGWWISPPAGVPVVWSVPGPVSVPEPASLLVLAVGVAGVVAVRRR